MTPADAPSIILAGIGAHAPSRIVTNEELSRTLDTSDEWIRSRSGIGQRHLGTAEERASDFATAAARKALQHAGLTPADIDLLILATMSPDYPFPSTACVVQDKLGLGHVPAFDLSAACSGFLYALETASALLRAGNYRRALVIGAEKMSSILDWQDRTTCVLFGDGAGAVVLEKVPQPGIGLLGSRLGSDGSRLQLLYTPAGGSAHPITAETLQAREHYLRMNGKEIFKVAVRHMAQTCEDILAAHQIEPGQIACVIPHQANIRIIESLAKHLNLPLEKFILNIERYGNTSAASIPIALEEALSQQRIRPGDHVLMAAFGGGLTWAASLLRWHH